MLRSLLAACQLLLAAADGHVGFLHGVASGDPLHDAVIIWTRYTPDESAECCPSVTWYIAKNEVTGADLSNPLQTGTVNATADRDFTVKVDVTGLEPGTDYVFGFSSGSAVSPVGMTRTAPSGPVAELTYVFVSCAHYTFGYFHAYDVASTITDLDFWVHLGDYIYESADYGYSGDVRSHTSPYEAVSLEDYRLRYSQYNTDEAVQNLRRRAPMIAVWDDHEVANNNFDSGADNHQPTCAANRNSTDAEKDAAKCDQDEGSYSTRAHVAVQAWLEWMPIREQPGQFGEFDFNVTQVIEWGDLLTILGLDTRLSARNESGADIFFSPLAALAVSNDNVTAWQEEPLKSQFEGAAELFNSGNADPHKVMIGQEQMNLLESVFQRSKDAGKPWQVYASSVMMGPLLTPNFELLPDAVSLIDPALQPSMRLFIDGLFASTDPSPVPPLTIGQAARIFTAIGMFNAMGSTDDWNGYANERRLLLEMFNSSCANAIAIGGDLHDSYLWTMRENAQLTGEPVAVNVGTPSVSSPGEGRNFHPIFMQYVGILQSQGVPGVTPQLAWDLLHLAMKSTMPDLQFVNVKDKGFVAAKVSHTEHVVNYILVNDAPDAADHDAPLRKTYAAARGSGLTASSYCAGSFATTAGRKGSLTPRRTSCNVQFDTARPLVWTTVQVPREEPPSVSSTVAPPAETTEDHSASASSSSAAAPTQTTGSETSGAETACAAASWAALASQALILLLVTRAR